MAEKLLDKIEITPEMIEAGARILMESALIDLSPTCAEIVAEEVLCAGLARARPRPRHPGHQADAEEYR